MQKIKCFQYDTIRSIFLSIGLMLLPVQANAGIHWHKWELKTFKKAVNEDK